MGYGGGGGGGGGSGGSGGSGGGSGYRRVGEDRTANLKVNNITNRTGGNGTEVDGIVEAKGTHFVPPSGTTAERGSRGRGLIGGSFPANRTFLNTLTIATTGNAISFGALANEHAWGMAAASSTRGTFAGGYNPSEITKIDYVTFSTEAGASNFGDLRTGTKQGAGFSDSTRGFLATGATAPSVMTGAINFITISTGGSDQDFGDALERRRGAKGLASPTRGVFARGGLPDSGTAVAENAMEYVTMQSKGNSIDFGDRTLTNSFQGAAASNTTRGIFAGGWTASPLNNSNIIDYITISSTGNAVDFGDLTSARHGGDGMSSATRAVFAGLWDGAADETIDYVTIATTGNATDFGDTTIAVYYSNCCSDSHGGLG